jgi:adenine-specific DNA-methyltransferase
MEKLELKSKDLVEKNIERLKELFPEVVTENKIDFEKLQILLGEEIEEDDERYNFTWKGKRKAIKLSQIQSTGTLRPCKEESKNWDTTENLYIEGDNLEVLRLLQEPYYDSVKMIYIDPPYNTGNDFVYKDDYKDNLAHYKEMTEQKSSNPETSGRYHTDWLNMMYPRLRLARNLLREDGVIFISIDDHEVHNLRKICDEIFGESNFVGEIIRKTKSMTADKNTGFNLQHENLIIYSKNIEKTFLKGEEKKFKNYSNPDNDPKGEWTSADPSAKSGGDTTYFKIKNPYTGKVDYPPEGRYWAFSKDTLKEYIDGGKIKFRKNHSDNQRGFTFKRYKNELDSLNNPVNSLFAIKNLFMNQKGTKELQNLFEKDIFDNPKPFYFIKKLIKYTTSDSDIVLDFFAGSSTTAHALMSQNLKDSQSRKFIMVQLEEPTPEKSEARNFGYKTITEIGKERIRKAGEKIKKEYKNINNLDTGFKVFKLDTSNLKVWNPVEEYEQLSINDIKEKINNHIDILLPDRTSEDLLYEIMLKYKLKLTTPIEELNLNGKKCFNVGYGYLLLCLDKEIDKDTINAICDYKRDLIEDIGTEDIMKRVVFIENAFTDDNLKINSIQTLKQLGIEDIKIV